MNNFKAYCICVLIFVFMKFSYCLSENDYSDYINPYPDMAEDNFSKRNNLNRFKNMMLTKDANDFFESRDDEKSVVYIPRVAPPKRVPGAILSWAIPAAANKVRIVNTSYRPPGGVSRPAAK